MLRLFGQRPDSRDGGTRRELLRVGALSLFGSMTTPRLLRAADSGGGRRPGKARSVILFNLLGGPSHQDMFDLKPLAPAEIRGEFQPDRDLAAGAADLRAPAEDRPADAQGMPDPHGHARLQLARPAADHDRLHRRRPAGSSGPSRPIRPTSARSASTSGWGRRSARRGLPAVLSRAGASGAVPRHPPPGPVRRLPRAASTTRSSRECEPTFDREPSRHYYDPVWPIGEPTLPGAGRPAGDDRRPPRPPPVAAGSARRRLRAGELAAAHRPDGPVPAAGVRPADVRQDPRRLRSRAENPARSAIATAATCSARACSSARRLVEAGVPFVSVHHGDLQPPRPLLRHAREQLRHAQGLQPARCSTGSSRP